MIIKDYKFTEEFYIKRPSKTNIRQIVIGNIYEYSFNNFIKSTQRIDGSYKFPHYTIDIDGNTYKHIDNNYYTKYLSCDIDESVISIGLFNIGALRKFDSSSQIYIDIFNNEYSNSNQIDNTLWKGVEYWVKYPEEQIKALSNLCILLCNELNIPMNIQPSNVKRTDINHFTGISFRSNHNQKHYDVTPAFNIELFKSIIHTQK